MKENFIALLTLPDDPAVRRITIRRWVPPRPQLLTNQNTSNLGCGMLCSQRGQLKAEQQNGWTDYRDRAHYGREGNNINQSHILVGLDTYQQKVRKIGKSGLGQTNDKALQLIVLSFLEFAEQTVCCICWF